MKKITNWIKKNKKLQSFRWFLIKHLTTIAFKVIAKSRFWNEYNYENNVIQLYKAVKRRKAFVFKAKIVDPGRGIKHYKILFVETPYGKIEVKLMRQDNPDFFKSEQEIFKLNDNDTSKES